MEVQISYPEFHSIYKVMDETQALETYLDTVTDSETGEVCADPAKIAEVARLEELGEDAIMGHLKGIRNRESNIKELEIELEGMAKMRAEAVEAASIPYEAEIDRLNKRIDSFASRNANIKSGILYYLQMKGLKKITGALFTVWRQLARPAITTNIPIADMPEAYVKTERKFDRNAVLERWKANEEIPDGITVEQREFLQIR